MKRLRTWMWVGGFLLLIAFGTLLWVSSGAVAFPVPNPNGYADFLAAAASLRGGAPDYFTQRGLRAAVARSGDAYGLVRVGLDKACAVPVEPTKAWATNHETELARLKLLTHFLIADAKLAEAEGRVRESLDGYLRAYRFAGAMDRGGLLLDYLNCVSCRALVSQHFQSLIPILTPEQREEALHDIEKVESEQDKPAVVARRQYRWQLATFGLRGRIDSWESRLRLTWQTRSLAPLRPEQSLLADRTLVYQQQSLKPVCEKLRQGP